TRRPFLAVCLSAAAVGFFRARCAPVRTAATATRGFAAPCPALFPSLARALCPLGRGHLRARAPSPWASPTLGAACASCLCPRTVFPARERPACVAVAVAAAPKLCCHEQRFLARRRLGPLGAQRGCCRPGARGSLRASVVPPPGPRIGGRVGGRV